MNEELKQTQSRLDKQVNDQHERDEAEFKASDHGKLGIELQHRVERLQILQLQIKHLSQVN